MVLLWEKKKHVLVWSVKKAQFLVLETNKLGHFSPSLNLHPILNFCADV